MGFSRQEYWSGLLFPSPGDLPDPGINPGLLHCRQILYLLGFPGGSDGKESAHNVGDLSLIARLGRSPGEGNSNPLQYSGLENPMDCKVHGVTKSWIRLSDFHFFTFFAFL